MNAISLLIAAVAIVVGLIAGYVGRKIVFEQRLTQAKENAAGIIATAQKEAATAKKEAILEAREESHRYREGVEQELKDRRSEVQKQEERLLQREATLDRKDTSLENRETTISARERKLDQKTEQIQKRQQQAADLVEQRQAELEKVAQLSHEEAKKRLLSQLKEELQSERETMIRQSEQEAELTAEKNAKDLIVAAIQRSAADMVQETTVTVVTLPSDDMKGRIIGREGRNIRTLETLTGIDLIIDDTPEAVVLSGFDPVRREIAKMALERLIQDAGFTGPD